MKPMETTLLIALILSTVACRPQRTDNRAQMTLDAKPAGKNVTIVRPKEAVRPVEPIMDLKELPTIMQLDLNAAEKRPSKEVTYVKPGDAVRPSEMKR